MVPLLHARRLVVSVPGRVLCQKLSFEVFPGQCWGILGPNGAGKSSLLYVLAGLAIPESGEVLLDGRSMDKFPRSRIAQRVGVLFQEQSDPFPATVLETALIGRHPHLKRWQWESERDIQLVRDGLARVGLASLETRQVATLSGGERQRLAIAALLAQEPCLALLDEPVSHLDIGYQIEMLDLVTAQLCNEDAAVVMVLHDINLAVRYCDHLLLLFPGGEVLCGALEEVLDLDRLKRLYGHPMMSLDGPYGPVFLPA